MKDYRFRAKHLFALSSLIVGLALAGCSMAQGSLHNLTVSNDTDTSVPVKSSPVSIDTTAPEIDALNITIPYGTSLSLDSIASISDDQDEHPFLEIVSIVNITDSDSSKTDSTAEGSTLSSTASTTSTSAPALEVADSEHSDTAITLDSAAEIEPADHNYLFSAPGKYDVELKGTDKSSNESTKSIIITVTDATAPVFDRLHEVFEITDKDKKAPDYLDGVIATDEIDGDVTAEIIVDDSNILYNKAGSYNVTYSVSDLSGNEATAVTPVIIKDTTAPYLSVIGSPFNLFVTDAKPNYASLVSAIDAVDGDVKDTLTIDDSSVNYKKPGKYAAVFRVHDTSGNVAEKPIAIEISAGWKTQDNKTYYYSPKDGLLCHGWNNVDDKTYYFNPDDGHMLKGMATIDGNQYFLNENDGHLITGWQTINGMSCYFSPDDGHMYHSWSTIDGKRYYFDPSDGHLLTGSQTIDGKQYRLNDKDGQLITGWQTIKGKVYYFSTNDGHMYHDWSNIDGEEYFFDRTEGFMLTGMQAIDGGQYLFDDKDGHMITGWQTIDNEQYYFSPDDGHMYHDWSNIDGAEYYFDINDGHMYTGTHYVDGEEYDFGKYGVAKKVVHERSSDNSRTRSYSDYAYIGNANSGKFHRSSCSSVRDMNDYNKVGFDSRSEAIDAGYVPCKRCHP